MRATYLTTYRDRYIFIQFCTLCSFYRTATKEAINKMDQTIKEFLQNTATFPLTEENIKTLGNGLIEDYEKSILEATCDDDEGDACSTENLNDYVTQTVTNIKKWADAKTWVSFINYNYKLKL